MVTPLRRKCYNLASLLRRITKTFFIMYIGLFIVGCSTSMKMDTVDEMVGEIIKHAADDDTAFFAQYMDSSYKGMEKELIKQIEASSMADNYKTRLDGVSETKARLNYHYLEKGCLFQIDLEKQNGSWIIKRIWFCR